MRETSPPLTEDTAWDHLRVFLEDFVGLWGKPIALARWLDFPAREYRVCSAWLRALEGLLRRLLLVAASRVAPPPEPEKKTWPARKQPTVGASFASDDSADWRVSFKLNMSKRKRGAARRGKTYPRRFWDPVPLALRFEALMRAANDPDRYIQRAARALAKNATLPNVLVAQKLKNMSALRPYAAQGSLLLLGVFPDAWRAVDTS